MDKPGKKQAGNNSRPKEITVNLDLSSVQAKVDHSAKHFQTLEDKVSTWKNGDFCSIEAERNTKFTEHSLFYRSTQEPDLLDWSLVFGDCIHNLRCALDHLVYSIAAHESKISPPPGWRQLAFPIVDSDSSFDGFNKGKFGAKGGVRFISDPVVAAIKTMQPYKRTHPYLPPLLRLLREFDDADEHRLLHLAVTQGVEWQFDNITGLAPESGRLRFVPHDVGELKDNTKIATLTTDGPAPDLNFDRFLLRIGAVVAHDPGPSGTTHTLIEQMIYDLGKEVGFAIETVVAAMK